MWSPQTTDNPHFFFKLDLSIIRFNVDSSILFELSRLRFLPQSFKLDIFRPKYTDKVLFCVSSGAPKPPVTPIFFKLDLSIISIKLDWSNLFELSTVVISSARLQS